MPDASDSAPSAPLATQENNRPWRTFLPFLIRIAKHFRPFYGCVLRLTSNLFVKYGRLIDLSEASAMQYVAQHTSIPVPRVVCAFESRAGIKYILMTAIKGERLDLVWHQLSEAEKREYLTQLRGYVSELRNIVPLWTQEGGRVGGVGDSQCRDPCVDAHGFGPFQDHEAFHSFLRGEFDDACENADLQKVINGQRERTYRSVLTHGDLAPRNVIVSNRKISGIIDWETAGWYPEYWEYTTAWQSNWNFKEWRERMDEFLDPYPKELEINSLRLTLFGE
ncbi:hypothetical protein RUND412_007245 [Rhizina undulata]